MMITPTSNVNMGSKGVNANPMFAQPHNYGLPHNASRGNSSGRSNKMGSGGQKEEPSPANNENQKTNSA